MISTHSDYLFVSGTDFDNFIIDGGVMPLRTGTSSTTGVPNANILRGEDVAFLREALVERQWHPGHSPATFIVSKSVGNGQEASTVTGFRNVIANFISRTPIERNGTFTDPFDNIRRSVGDLTTPAGACSYGNSLLKSDILYQFSDLRLMTIKPIEMEGYTELTQSSGVTSIQASYPKESVTQSQAGATWDDYGGRTKTDPHTGDPVHNAYGGNAWASMGVSLSIDLPSFPLASVDYWASGSVTHDDNGSTSVFDSLMHLGMATGGSLTVTNEQMKSIAAAAFSRSFSWEPGTLIMDENVRHQCYVGVANIFAVVTLGDHTKWW